MIDGNGARQAILVPHVLDVAVEIGDARFEGLDIFMAQIRDLNAPVILEGTYGRDDHGGCRPQIRLAAFDIHELLSSQVRPETCLGHYIVGEFQGGASRHYRVASVRNVGEWPTV